MVKAEDSQPRGRVGSNPNTAEETINMSHSFGSIMLPLYRAKINLALLHML